MIEGDFDRSTLATMNAALDLVCEKIPRGEEHAGAYKVLGTPDAPERYCLAYQPLLLAERPVLILGEQCVDVVP